MKITTWFGIMGLTLWVSHVALGEEKEGSTVWDGFSGFLSPNWEKDFSVSIGAKVWLNEWTQDLFAFQNSSIAVPNPLDPANPQNDVIIFVETTDSYPDTRTSDIEATPIPQLSLRYKWLFLTGSHFYRTDFDFETVSLTTNFLDRPSNTPNLRLLRTEEVSIEGSAERYEWDVSGGIYVHPYMAISGGYKKVGQHFEDRLSLIENGIQTDDSQEDFRFEIRGPTVGVAASVPMGKGLGIYASYAHGFMTATIGDKFKADYDVAELGFSYTHGTKHLAPHMPLSAATAYVGYRYQIIKTEVNNPLQDRTDLTRGFAAGVNLSF